LTSKKQKKTEVGPSTPALVCLATEWELLVPRSDLRPLNFLKYFYENGNKMEEVLAK
jgi:hypothetical protein